MLLVNTVLLDATPSEAVGLHFERIDLGCLSTQATT